MNLMAVSFQGVAQATQRFDRAAQDVAESANGAGERPLETAMVDMMQAEIGVRANLAVQQSVAAAYGRLLDIRI